jgi:hypothetical protein
MKIARFQKLIPLMLLMQTVRVLAITTDTNSYFGNYTCWTYEIHHYNEAEDRFVLNAKAVIKGDTIINDVHYKKYSRYWYGEQSFIALRQENKKVFVINMDSDEEYMLYDFGLEVGDSIVYMFNSGSEYEYNITVYVEGVDSITLDNGKRYKRMTLRDNYNASGLWVEGIGNMMYDFEYPYPHYATTCLCGDYYHWLCFIRENEQVIFRQSDQWFQCACDILNDLRVKKTVQTDVFAESNYIRIKGDLTIFPRQMKVFNATGQLLFDKTVTSGTEQISIAERLEGIYFYRLLGKDDTVKTGQLWIK